MAMAQYLSDYLFDKYEYEAIFVASWCGLPVRTSMKTESVSAMVDDSNITLTSFRIICYYIKHLFVKRAILPEEAVQNLGTGYMEAEYRKYEYEKEKGMEKENINFWYI